MALLGPICFSADGWNWYSGFPKGPWDRFRYYTKRIRSLAFNTKLYNGGNYEFEEKYLDRDVPVKLLYYVATNNGGFLLPHIRRLRCHVSTDRDLSVTLPFISSTLKEVDIECHWEVSLGATFRMLSTLHSALPKDITSFRFVPNADKADHETTEELTAIVSSRPTLQKIIVPTMPLNVFTFPTQLRVLQTTLDEWCPESSEDFLSRISTQCPQLEALKIMFGEETPLTFDSLRPLLRCTRLRSLDLDSIFSGPVELEEKDIEEMGRTWRDMEALHISCRGFWDAEARAGGTRLASLATFAQAFSPTLRQIAIYFDFSKPPPPPYPPIRFPSLQYFQVGTSQYPYRRTAPEVHVKVQTFLDATLPYHLKHIHSQWSGFDHHKSVLDWDKDPGFACGDWDSFSEEFRRFRGTIGY